MNKTRFSWILGLFMLLFLFLASPGRSEEKYTPDKCRQDLTQYLERYFENSQSNPTEIPIIKPYELSIVIDKIDPPTLHVFFKAIPHAFLIGYNPQWPNNPNTESFITPKVKRLLEKTPFADFKTITCPASPQKWDINMLTILRKEIDLWYGHHQDTEFIGIFDEKFDQHLLPLKREFNLHKSKNASPIPIYLPSWEYYTDENYDTLKIEVFAHAFRCEKNDTVCEDEKLLLENGAFTKEFQLKKRIFGFTIKTKDRKLADLEKELDAKAAELANEIIKYYIQNTADFI